MRKRIGFFGGSFDPIHFGHLSLAIHLFENHQLDEVLFCPAFCSPFKTETPPIADGKHRLAMLKAVLSEIPHFKICTLELDRKGPSYTIDTIRSLKKEEESYHLLLSEETSAHFAEWKEAKELMHLAPPLTGPREMAVSSTLIRERLKKRLYCGHLVPAKALDYIQAHHLYS